MSDTVLYLLESGACSDRDWGPLLRGPARYDFEAALLRYRAEWVPGYEWEEEPAPEDFIGWLARQPEFEELDFVPVHCGEFGSAAVENPAREGDR